MDSATLRLLFNPTSVAVIGATGESNDPGDIVMRNLLSGAFLGPVMPVHEEQIPILDQESYRSVDTLPLTPDLAIICSPPETVPEYLLELGKRGTRAAVILSQGFFRTQSELARDQMRAIKTAIQEYGVRILGPNCLGFINPHIGLNASLAHCDAKPGKIAFVSQSDSLFTSVLDWASSKDIGFSYFISLGDRLDIHFGHALDFLNGDYRTRAVLLYVETITNARAFMSAARATARNKPVLVIKAGRSQEGALAAAQHSGAYLGLDDVYEAAFQRAGMLRVFDIDTLFDTVETLARTRPLRGDRLAILTNGGGPGFLATDALRTSGGRLASLGDETRAKLDELLSMSWSTLNPLVLTSSASPEMYQTALDILLKDPSVDAVLVMHVPTASVDSLSIAEAVVKSSRKTKRNILTSWLGINDAASSRELFASAGIPTYFTPDKAVRAFLNMVEYRSNQELLMEVPASLPDDFEADTLTARNVVSDALEANRQRLTEPEAKTVLSAYDIPVAETLIAPDVDGAVASARQLGYPVALKILSPDITRKSKVGGVVLDLDSDDAVRDAAQAMSTRITDLAPDATVDGFTVQKMARRARAHELFVEISTDPVFGPTIRFGQGGPVAEILSDLQVGLPPLNMHLAKALISKTRVAKLLSGSLGNPRAAIDDICLTLIKISQLIIDIPDIFELVINPLYADEHGVLALDAQIHVARSSVSGPELLAIRPYPKELEECFQLKDGSRVLIRPIRPEDEPAHWAFIDALSAEDKRFRFFGNIGQLPRAEMTKFTQIDYDREMAFVVKREDDSDDDSTLGVVRAMTAPDNITSEFAITVRSDIKRVGLGRILMEKIIRYCKSRGTQILTGQALADNAGMVGLAEAMGFEVTKDFDDDVYDFSMVLNTPLDD